MLDSGSDSDSPPCSIGRKEAEAEPIRGELTRRIQSVLPSSMMQNLRYLNKLYQTTRIYMYISTKWALALGTRSQSSQVLHDAQAVGTACSAHCSDISLMIVTKRESMASLIHDTSPTLRHSLQQSHNKGLYYGFRDAILSRLVTIIKRLVHHAVYCISLSCLLSFLCNPYIPFLIYKIFPLLVSFHFFYCF